MKKTFPRQVYHGWFERGKFLYYKTRNDYKNGSFKEACLPKWLDRVVKSELKDQHKEGKNSLRTEITNLLRYE